MTRNRVRDPKRRTGFSMTVPGRKRVYIYKNLFEYLVKSQDGFLSSSTDKPRLYFVGANEHGVLVGIKKVSNSPGGCWNMPAVTVENMTDAAVTMAKMGYTIAGLARVGKFNIKPSGSMDGYVLRDLTRDHPNMLLLSFGLEGLRITGVYRNREVTHNHVVTKKKEGGEVSGKEKRSGSEKRLGEGRDPSDVREVVSPGGHSGVDKGDVAQRVSESASSRLQSGDSGEQAGSADGLRPAGQGYSHDGDQGDRGPALSEQVQRVRREALRREELQIAAEREREAQRVEDARRRAELERRARVVFDEAFDTYIDEVREGRV